MTTPTIPTSNVISVDIADFVGTVWLDRPEKLNAMNRPFWVEFPAIIEALGAHDEIRVIVIAGRGRAFTVGLDLNDFGAALATGSVGGEAAATGNASGAASRGDTYQQIKRMQHTFSSLAACDKPIIAAVHGYCIGAGVDLITAADIRLAATETVFSVRETKIGMVADVGTMQRLPRIVDPGRVAELVFTGKDFDAAEAAEMGLVTRVLPDVDALMADAHQLASDIAANSPLVVQGAKHVLRNNDGKTLEEQLDYVALWNAAFLHSNDLSEALTAYIEKRPPKFTGT